MANLQNIVYKIRDKQTGLFSTGGYSPNWTREGKTWKTKAQVISHLKLFCRGYRQEGGRTIPKTWIIVEFGMIEVGSEPAISSVKKKRAAKSPPQSR